MVPRRGLEPPRCYPLVPESSEDSMIGAAFMVIVFPQKADYGPLPALRFRGIAEIFLPLAAV